MSKQHPPAHSCLRCCGPRKGATRDALAVQNEGLKDELGQALAAAAIAHELEPLPALVEHDLAARLRWRNDHLERQLRDLGVVPNVPPFPGLSDPARWLQQIAAVKAKQAEREAAA